MTKVCTKCGIEKDYREYHKRNYNKEPRSWCKDCEKADRKRYYNEHKEQEALRKKLYNARYPERNNKNYIPKRVKKTSRERLQEKLIHAAKQSYANFGGLYKDTPEEYIDLYLKQAALKRVAKILKEAKYG